MNSGQRRRAPSLIYLKVPKKTRLNRHIQQDRDATSKTTLTVVLFTKIHTFYSLTDIRLTGNRLRHEVPTEKTTRQVERAMDD